MFNHPGQYGSDSFEQFNFPKTRRIVGMELWNRDKDYYSREGTDGVRYYDEALQKGWYIGAEADKIITTDLGEQKINLEWPSSLRIYQGRVSWKL